MGLADLTPAKDTGGSTGSRKGKSHRVKYGGKNPDPGDFPIYTLQCPQILIYEDSSGELQVLRYPHTPETELVKEWYSDPWTVETPSENWVRWFMEEKSWKRVKRRVQEELDLDLNDLLDENPERALKAINMAVNQKVMEKLQPTERCPVCRERIHVLYDSYEVVNNRRCCSKHTVAELKEADLL